MTNQNRKATDWQKSPGLASGEKTEREAGGKLGINETLLTERVELAHLKPHQNVESLADEKPLLPHERDQTTGDQGTGLNNEDERSRAVIGQAAEDTKRGLKDTERRGIPSEILASDDDGADAIEKIVKKL